MNDFLQYKELATKAALIGGDILNKYFNQNIGFDIKVEFGNAAGLVTKADKESEDAICSFLLSNIKDFGILGEEGGIFGNQKNKWIIDPLDGTTNFYHAFPQFCISIGLEIDGQICVGVIYNPITKQMYHAVKGGGAFMNDKKISVSKTTKLEDAMLGTGFAYMRGAVLDNALEMFKKFTLLCHGIRRPGSAALDLCNVASGVYDGFYEATLKPWDVAAGSLIITEAGGKVSGFNGENFSIFGNDVLACNGLIYKEMLEVIKLQ